MRVIALLLGVLLPLFPLREVFGVVPCPHHQGMAMVGMPMAEMPLILPSSHQHSSPTGDQDGSNQACTHVDACFSCCNPQLAAGDPVPTIRGETIAAPVQEHGLPQSPRRNPLSHLLPDSTAPPAIC